MLGTAAANYDAWFDSPLGNACFASEAALIRKGAGDPQNLRVLEVGCGSGRFLLDVFQESALAIGLDRDMDMLRVAKRKTPSSLVQRYAWIQGDASALPFRDESFDLVYESTVLCFGSNPATLIAEMTRTCRLGGRILLGELAPLAPWQLWRRLKGRLGFGAFRHTSWHCPSTLRKLLESNRCAADFVGKAIFFPLLNLPEVLYWRTFGESLGRSLWPWAGAYYLLAGLKQLARRYD